MISIIKKIHYFKNNEKGKYINDNMNIPLPLKILTAFIIVRSNIT